MIKYNGKSFLLSIYLYTTNIYVLPKSTFKEKLSVSAGKMKAEFESVSDVAMHIVHYTERD